MAQSLNNAPSVNEYTTLVYQFKRWYNWYCRKKGYKTRLFLFSLNLYGLEEIFDLWLSFERDILNLDKHMEKLEKEFKRLDLYFKRSTGRQTIINR